MRKNSSVVAALEDNEIFLRRVFSKHVTSTVLAMFGGMASSLANSVLAGIYLGADGLAVMSVVAPFYFLFSVVGSLVGVGGATLAGYALGRDDKERVGEAFSWSLLLCLGISLGLALLGTPFLAQLIAAFGCPSSLMPAAMDYGLIFLWGGFGAALFYLPFNFLRLVGRLRLTVLLCSLMGGINVGLDFLLLYLGLGIEAIALGTVASQIIISVAGCVFLLKGEGAWRVRWPAFRRDALRLMKLGSPSAGNNFLTFVRLILLNRLVLAVSGETGLAALSVVTALENFSVIFLSGIAQGTSSFVSVFSKEYDTVSVRRVEKQAHLWGFTLVAALTVLILGFDESLCRFFGIQEAVKLTAATEAVRIFAFSLPLSVCGYLMFFYFQAVGFTALANVLVLCRALLFLIFPAWLLAAWYGLAGVWWAYPVAALSPIAVMGLALPYYRRRGYSGFLLQDLSAEREGEYLSFAVRANPEAIIAATDQIEAFCEQNQLTGKEQILIKMSMEEMMLSIAEHCFPPGKQDTIDGRILLHSRGEDLMIVLRLRNGGQLYNPIEYYESLKEKDPLALGDALGIAMVMKAADAIHYKTTFGINNLTIIIERKGR